MAEIPENVVTQEDLNEWYRLQEELRRVKAAEMTLRMKIFKGMFTNPVEGTNTTPLSGGWVIKGKRVIQRDVDLGSLTAYSTVDASGQSKLMEAGINIDTMIKWKPELVTKEYRKLTPAQLQVFDNVLIIKDGSPSLEIVLPASAQKEKLEDLKDLAMGGHPDHQPMPA